MPGSVLNAAPSAILPNSLSKAFSHAREYISVENQYRNGESQRNLLAQSSRKRWRLSKRLTPTLLRQLRDFYDARNGPQEPFYFYDPWESVPKLSYDPTGRAAAAGSSPRL